MPLAIEPPLHPVTAATAPPIAEDKTPVITKENDPETESPPAAVVTTTRARTALAVPRMLQPSQLGLFRLVQEGFTNAFNFYEAIPRFVVARGKHRHYQRNPDGSTAPLKRHFTF
ncbi:MAG: hypothetical protein ACT4N2_13400 [Hyphomicrobium sp.]